MDCCLFRSPLGSSLPLCCLSCCQSVPVVISTPSAALTTSSPPFDATIISSSDSSTPSSSSAWASSRSSSNLSVNMRSITAVASGPSPCTLGTAPFRDERSPSAPPAATRFSSCSLSRLLATTSATSASHPSISEWRMHAADAGGATLEPPPPLLSLSLIPVAVGGRKEIPPVSSKLRTSSSKGIKSMGSDSSEFTDPPPAAAVLPNGLSEESPWTPNSFRKARSISVMRGTKMKRNTLSGCGLPCGGGCALLLTAR
mmetsp:Transcript_23266/g.49767  ORF Transcript_23266/g.49767 Transcript_23266/m.49767 type:complete len:257 (+) Transcript_23266:1636-2406(+)